MALPSSGPISLSDIQTEFGGSNPIGLNEYYAGGAYVPSGTTGTYGAVPSSGAICMNVFHGTSKPVVGQQAYTTPGTYTWVAPAGVTKISFVVVGSGGNGGVYGFVCGMPWAGGGGGGGGGLAYKNNFTVTPGGSYTVKVRAGGIYCGASTIEQRSTYFCNATNYGALSGRCGRNAGCGGNGGDGGYANCGTLTSGWGRGGNGGSGTTYVSCLSTAAGGGGGGAAGYSGVGPYPSSYDGAGGGGSGAINSVGTSNLYGGGGGGGISGCGSYGSGGGGGVGILGVGSNGQGGWGGSGWYGGGGSGGANSCGGNGGAYGGGGAGLRAINGNSYRLGASGAVRIIWPGNTRSFPSTCTGNL